MKKVLILTYCFPPCNLTPSERVYAYAKSIVSNGHQPIVICRNWDIEIKRMEDRFESSGTEVEVGKELGIETHYVPYTSNLPNRMLKRYTGTQYYFLYQIMSALYQFLQLPFGALTSLNPIYQHAKKIIQEENINLIVVSGSPFGLFKFGHSLSKKFNIPWVADYRDDWSTNELNKQGKLRNLLSKWTSIFEKKWLSNVTFFVSVSDYYVKKISQLIKKPGITIENGFIEDNYQPFDKENQQNAMFTISYVGSLYIDQPIEVFLTGVKNFIRKHGQPKLQINFVGLLSQKVAVQRVKKEIVGFQNYFQFTERVPKHDAIRIQQSSDLLFTCAYKGLKGIPGSKIYEFMALRKPVLICPSDKDIIRDTLLKTGQGIIAENENEVEETLIKLYTEWEKHDSISSIVQPNSEEINKFTRTKLSQRFVDLCKEHSLL